MSQSDGSSLSQMTHNSFAVSAPEAIPDAERLPNKHLYTCKKELKRQPLVVHVGETFDPVRGHLSVPVDDYGYGYTLKGVFDSSLKTETEWSMRRFESAVSSIDIPEVLKSGKSEFRDFSNLLSNITVLAFV